MCIPLAIQFVRELFRYTVTQDVLDNSEASQPKRDALNADNIARCADKKDCNDTTRLWRLASLVPHRLIHVAARYSTSLRFYWFVY